MNTITLRKYADDALFKNVRATYAYVGDRLLWTRWSRPMTKKEVLEEREDEARWGRRNLRWEGEPAGAQKEVKP